MIPIRAERLLWLAAAATLALGGCGGDDEKEPAATTTPPLEQGSTVPPASKPTTEESAGEDRGTEKEKPRQRRERGGENREGGAGDEEAARTEVRLTGRGGRVEPAQIQVAAFIGIRVIVRSRDDHTYAVAFGNDGASAPPRRARAFSMEGLRTGETRQGRVLVDGRAAGALTITATNEPGP